MPERRLTQADARRHAEWARRSSSVAHSSTHACVASSTTFGADSDVPADLCIKAGGQVLQQTQWMVHVWSVPGWESQQGLFGEVNPALSCPDGTYYQLPLDQWVDHPLNVCRV